MDCLLIYYRSCTCILYNVYSSILINAYLSICPYLSVFSLPNISFRYLTFSP